MEWKLENQDGAERLLITGNITETANFQEIVVRATAKSPLRVNVEHVERINSCGVREWMTFVKALNDTGVSIVLEKCSPEVVCQLNALVNFVGRGGGVSSVFAPYYCENCEKEHLELIDLTHPAAIPEAIKCLRCGEAMEFDDFAETYLAFQGALRLT